MIKYKNQGFTLIEIAIVLVIIAFIVGAIIGGNQLVDSSRRQSAISDFKRFQTAYTQFAQKYMAIPGDMKDAATIFGSPPIPSGYTSVVNGNGLVDYPTDTNRLETYGAWQQLGLAGFLNKNFSGSKTSSSNSLVNIGKDVPEGPYQGGGYTMQSYALNAAYQTVNVIYLAKGKSQHDINENLILPRDAILIDQQIDDGKPKTGRFHAQGGATTVANASDVCITSGAVVEDDTYNTGAALKSCIMLYLLEEENKL